MGWVTLLLNQEDKGPRVTMRIMIIVMLMMLWKGLQNKR